jgi:hypothetical protein
LQLTPNLDIIGDASILTREDRAMAAKRNPTAAERAEGVLNTVARTVGSTLGTIVAKTERAIEKRGEMLEGLKDSVMQKASEIPAAITARAPAAQRATRPKKTTQRSSKKKTAARKPAATRKRTSTKRASSAGPSRSRTRTRR